MRPGRREPDPGSASDSPNRGDSLLRGGLRGIGVVTAATIGVALVATVIAFLVSLLY